MAPEFSVKTLPNKNTIGETLHKKRVSLGYDFDKVERSTNIKRRFLEAFEKNEFKKLPPEPYATGFLKNYANFLDLRESEVIAQYKKEKGLKETLKNRKTEQKKSFSMPKMIITPKSLLIYGVSLLAITVFVYIGWQVRILAAPPRLEITDPKENSTTDLDHIEIKGKTDAGADIYINDYLIGGSPDGNFKEKISLQNGLNTIKIKAKNKIGKETLVERSLAANLKPVETAKVEKQKVELKIDIGPNSSWIYLEIDGVPLEKDGIIMLSGAERTFTAKEKIILWTKNAGSTNITFNGKDIGALGKEGEEIKNREFTKDMVIK